MEEKKHLQVVNLLDEKVGIEVYYYEENKIKCEPQFLKKEQWTAIIKDEIHEIVVYNGRRFHHITRDVLDRKIESIEFPYFTATITYNDSISISLKECSPE